jgi:hypothetical protein
VGRPELHPTDAILDGARGVVLEQGLGAATIAAIAESSGAPVGSIYHLTTRESGRSGGIVPLTVHRPELLDGLRANLVPGSVRAADQLDVLLRHRLLRQPGGSEGGIPIRESKPANDAAVSHGPHAISVPGCLHTTVLATARRVNERNT